MAEDINSVTLIGRLTRDAELKYTNTGTAISKFSIAVNRRLKRNDQWTDEVSYFDCVLWGKRGEGLNQYLSKGTQIAVAGELRQNRWEQDGQKRSKVEIIANNIELLGGGKGGNTAKSNYSPEQKPEEDSFGGSEEFNDDIPF